MKYRLERSAIWGWAVPLWVLILRWLSGVAERTGSRAGLLGANPGVASSMLCNPGKETQSPLFAYV